MGPFAELVEVLKVQADDALGSTELLDGLERIDAGACPVARIGAGADSFAAPFADFQHGIRVPIMRRLGMIVNRHVNFVFFTQPFD